MVNKKQIIVLYKETLDKTLLNIVKVKVLKRL